MTALAGSGLVIPRRLDVPAFALDAGQLTLLVGPNGAGKTSLIHALAGIGVAGDAVTLDGVALDTLSPDARIGRIALLPASREVGWPLTAADLVALGFGRRHDPAAVARALDGVEATALASRRVDRLSTGERARVLLARALVACPAVLLLDEPVAHLDPGWQLGVLRRLAAEAARGAAVLASIHDLALARAFADRAIVMDRGAIVADGPPQEALSDAVLAQVFAVRWTSAGWASA